MIVTENLAEFYAKTQNWVLCHLNICKRPFCVQRIYTWGFGSIVLDYALQLQLKKVVTWWMKRNSCTKGKAPCSVQNHLGQEKKENKRLLASFFSPLRRQCIENSTCLRPNALSHLLLLFLPLLSMLENCPQSTITWLKEQRRYRTRCFHP